MTASMSEERHVERWFAMGRWFVDEAEVTRLRAAERHLKYQLHGASYDAIDFAKEADVLRAENTRLRSEMPTVGWVQGMVRNQEKMEAEVDRLRARLALAEEVCEAYDSDAATPRLKHAAMLDLHRAWRSHTKETPRVNAALTTETEARE